jgi:murein DD-endopeptidase MepM/ murein hydrolase activator NlpD
VEAMRDLAWVEPWRESLERSRARREKSTRSPKPVTRVVGIAALALALLASLAVLGGDGHRASVTAARAEAAGTAAARPARAGSDCRAGAVGGRRACPPVVSSSGYVDPLAGARVKPERIDMGVDYAGSGTLRAIGTARLTYVAKSETGWPGAFIEYRLLGGPDAGRYVYYAEGVMPAAGLHVGQTVAAGQPIARIIPDYETGIELGWGAGANTKTHAEAGQWNATDDEDDVASPAGKSFSALIAALGGPPGKVEGRTRGRG